jgi:hypothetical protein
MQAEGGSVLGDDSGLGVHERSSQLDLQVLGTAVSETQVTGVLV